jgi:uncharacterized membrane protein YdjX (TVP38/TMEM64 family)
MSEQPRTKKPIGKRITQGLATFVTIAFPFLVITLLPVGKVVAKLDQILDRLGPLAIVVFIVAYIVDAVVLGPAWLFALAAGLAFGLVRGIVIVWFSATIAAGLAFLIARYLARHRVEKLARGNEKFEAVDRAIAKSGWKVALMLRISPILPYTIANYLYGLTAIKFLPYVVATAIGIIPMVAVYVSIGAAGRQAALAAAGGHQSTAEWIVLGVGIVVTVVAGILIARGAKRELADMRTARAAAAAAERAEGMGSDRNG